MRDLPSDPFEPGGINTFGRRLRAGEITAEAATAACLGRIEALDGRLGAWQHVAPEEALAAARAVDRLLAAGTDLGPLMGVPVAVKDIFAVEGMPTTAGSRVDVSDLIGPEGSFVKSLRRAGCVILGKTKTVEFALGATGISQTRGTPWNPWDPEVQRIPGGSSSGSAVATAAGMCGFAIGSDTGGSVRLPATFCGIFGLKTTLGLWPVDGVFPLAPDLDTIGPLTRTAEDAAIVWAALCGQPLPKARAPRGVRLGRPKDYFFDNLEPEVARCTEAAIGALADAGVEIVPIDLPEAREREAYFPIALACDLIAVLGRERFVANKDRIDPTVWARASRGLEVKADELLRLEWRRRELCKIAAERMAGLDGWVTPSAAVLPPPVEEMTGTEAGLRLVFGVTQNSQPGNLFGQCGTSTPIHHHGAPLPVGLQVLCRAFDEGRALGLARMIEGIVGAPRPPEVRPFLPA
jgi:aspartyl-tRNA(Asn)/glutamyl-tRNA(Gln) amidotransferase subunit A